MNSKLIKILLKLIGDRFFHSSTASQIIYSLNQNCQCVFLHQNMMRKCSLKRVMEEESRDFTMKLNETKCIRNCNVWNLESHLKKSWVLWLWIFEPMTEQGSSCSDSLEKSPPPALECKAPPGMFNVMVMSLGNHMQVVITAETAKDMFVTNIDNS